jgi:hypothetical protein
MAAPAYIEIGGRLIAWRELLQRRREQREAAARIAQPTLFELKEDCRPASERSAAGSYREPSLFTILDGEG